VTIQDDGPGIPQPAGPRNSGVPDPWDNDSESGPPVAEPVDGSGAVPLNEPTSKRASGARAFFDWVVVVTVALLVAFVVRGFVLAHFVVEGQSMATTLDTGDRVFVNKLSYRLHDPNRGDVVVLHQITGATERDLIKRVVGLPGETIEMTGCIVRITEPGSDAPQILDEPYLDEADRAPGSCGPDVTSQVIPDDHVFVMGDNRDGSQDSRALGPIEEDNLVGRAFIVFWPRDHWQWL
jgi:signal peptidase I